MEKSIFISYSMALILLVLCILIFSSTLSNRERLGRVLISIFGIYPGFLAVLWSLSLLFLGGEYSQVFGIMSAGLLLEVGAVQLSQVMKKFKTLMT